MMKRIATVLFFAGITGEALLAQFPASTGNSVTGIPNVLSGVPGIVSGAGTNCVLVNGTSNPCPSGGTPFQANLIAPTVGLTGQALLAGATVSIPAGGSIGADEAIVAAAAAGTTFIIGAGVHRQQYISGPKSGDNFICAAFGACIYNGSAIMTGWVAAGSYYTLTGVTNGDYFDSRGGICQSGTLCGYSSNLYMDQKPLTRISSQSTCSTSTGMTTGQYYYNTSTHFLCMYDNPASHVMEMSDSTYPCAICSTGATPKINWVTIKGLTVQMYATEFQFGAIGGQTPGQGWDVENCIIQLNHATGITLTSGVIRNNLITNNGCDGYELGIGLYEYPVGGVLWGNEISFNNWAGYAYGYGAGGGKIQGTVNSDAEYNYSHDNYGPGLWWDQYNVGARVCNNVVINNAYHGIQYEISYGGLICNNVVQNNGTISGSAGIFVSTSSTTEVFANHVYANSNAATVQINCDPSRGLGPDGLPLVCYGAYIHDNDLTSWTTNNYNASIQAAYGTPLQALALNQFANVWTNNHYHMSSTGGNTLYTVNNVTYTYYTLAQTQAFGFDLGSTIDTVQ
jgi:hypothetical protein